MTSARLDPRLGSRLATDFYDRPVLDVARDLIGCELIHDGVGGVIVETEAYHQSEPAAHSFVGPTPRAEVLFRAPGTTYVYSSYGIHTMLNAVCEAEGVGAAVLIRAIAPVYGIDRMIERRGRTRINELCSGPGKLGQALGIGLDLNTTSLIDGPIAIHVPDRVVQHRISTSTRIGITKAVELPWRFFASDDPNVSRGPRAS
ncbi:MAG: DNA-3-methyladenine glycosylase [Solirubrobacterales bacterium]